MGAFMRPYNTLLTDTTAIYIPLLKYATPTDFDGGTWSPASTDVKVSKDGGAAANITNLPTFVTDKGWKFILTAAELSCQQLVVRIADAATKVVCDDQFVVETTGNASSMWPDPDATNPVAADIAKIDGDATTATNMRNHFDPTLGYQAPLSEIGLSDGSITSATIDSTVGGEIADAVWDEPASGHTTAGTYGALAQIPAGVAQAGGSSTITLASGASTTDDIYNGRLIHVIAGTGSGQTRRISDYVGSTRVATVASSWSTTPDSTSEYAIIGN